MTEADSGDAPPANAAPAKKRRARKRAPAKSEPAATATGAKAAQPKPAAPAPEPLNQLMVEQTSESLAALSANLTQAMTRANQVFSTAFIEQAREGANWKPDPLGVQVALNQVWSHLAQQPETLREAHANLWRRYADIWQRHTAYMLTGQLPEEGPARDKRFKDP
jgi:hypothetical protein